MSSYNFIAHLSVPWYAGGTFVKQQIDALTMVSRTTALSSFYSVKKNSNLWFFYFIMISSRSWYKIFFTYFFLLQFNKHAMKNKDDSERTPRKACWSLEHRGTLGETALHLCFLSNNPMMTEMARALLELYPAMAFDQYEGQEYYGEWNKA